MKILGASYKTSTAGWAAILGALGIVLTQASYYMDSDPATVADWSVVAVAVAAAISGLGNLFARDEHVSSEKAGVK
jgi:hypothetical protein